MNDLAYLILIGALLLMAAWMLYARFASRSREKSLHHGLGDGPEREYADATSHDEGESEFLGVNREENADEELGLTAAEIKSVDGEQGKKGEGEYFDELQEAAAGLAVLMRSSPVAGRTTPVVFAPEEETDSAEFPQGVQTKESLSQAVMVSEPLARKADPKTAAAPVEPVREEKEGESNELEIDSSEPRQKSIEETEPSPEPVGDGVDASDGETKTEIRLILGDEVGDQFERIDSGLDALEELVLSMENGFSSLDSLVATSEEGVRDDSSSNVGAAA